MWADNARVVSVFAVIVLHVSAAFVGGVAQTDIAYGQGVWWVANFFDSVSRWCVPVFIMLSGYFLLNKKESDSLFFKKRISRILLPVIFWSVFFSAWLALKDYVKGESYLTLGKLSVGFLSGEPYFHLWYVYMIPFLYVVTPFVRVFIQSSDSGLLFRFIGFCFLLASGNVLLGFLFYGQSDTFFGNNFLLYLGYYAFGGYVAKYEFEPSSRCCVFWLLVAWVVTILGSYFFSYEYFYSYLSVNTVAASLCVFVLMRRFLRFGSAGGRLAALSFGVYLVHPVFLDVFSFLFKSRVSNAFEAVFYVSLVSIAVFVLSCFAAYCIKKFKFSSGLV